MNRQVVGLRPHPIFPLAIPATHQGTAMNRLIEIGFQQAGHWRLEDGRLVAELSRLATQRNILYAFICNGEVKYIGKTASTLAGRMRGYRNPAETQTTNIRNNSRIREILEADGTVDIYALPDNGLLHYGAFHLNLAAGLEDDLIRVINPEWNGGRAESLPVAVEEEPDRRLAPSRSCWRASNTPSPSSSTRRTTEPGSSTWVSQTRPTWDRTGRPSRSSPSRSPRPCLGRSIARLIRTADPRIMGGTALRDWFQATAAVKDLVRVDVFSPTAIRLARSSDGRVHSPRSTDPANAGP